MELPESPVRRVAHAQLSEQVAKTSARWRIHITASSYEKATAFRRLKDYPNCQISIGLLDESPEDVSATRTSPPYLVHISPHFP
jgi:hypothetical protein